MIRSLFRSGCIALAAAGLTAAWAAFDDARADPYRWCAHYTSGKLGGASNCWFMTLQQCRATVSGVGGYCAPNPFYDGLPIGTAQSLRPKQRQY
jgi:hypothetical protein